MPNLGHDVNSGADPVAASAVLIAERNATSLMRFSDLYELCRLLAQILLDSELASCDTRLYRDDSLQTPWDPYRLRNASMNERPSARRRERA